MWPNQSDWNLINTSILGEKAIVTESILYWSEYTNWSWKWKNPYQPNYWMRMSTLGTRQHLNFDFVFQMMSWWAHLVRESERARKRWDVFEMLLAHSSGHLYINPWLDNLDRWSDLVTKFHRTQTDSKAFRKSNNNNNEEYACCYHRCLHQKHKHTQ